VNFSWSDLHLALSAPRPRDGFTSRHMTVRGVRTHLRVATRAAGMPIVLLHGLAVSHRYLMPTARALAEGHPVYVPDLPGFGLSGKPRAVYRVIDHADHVAALMQRLDLPPACLVGNSFGGEVAARLAARYPDAVRALVLVGPTADPAARSYRGQVGRWLIDLVREDPRQAAILARDVRDAGLRRVVGTLSASVHNRIEADLAAVRAPTLLLRGSRDPVAPARWLAEAARACGGRTRVAGVHGAAHNAVTTAGAAVADLVDSFLIQHVPRQTAGTDEPATGRPPTDT
jgi:pimeloyl-ACP methyl ester carboxylesterase